MLTRAKTHIVSGRRADCERRLECADRAGSRDKLRPRFCAAVRACARARQRLAAHFCSRWLIVAAASVVHASPAIVAAANANFRISEQTAAARYLRAHDDGRHSSQTPTRRAHPKRATSHRFLSRDGRRSQTGRVARLSLPRCSNFTVAQHSHRSPSKRTVGGVHCRRRPFLQQRAAMRGCPAVFQIMKPLLPRLIVSAERATAKQAARN